MLESLLHPFRRGLMGLLFMGAAACGNAESYAPCSSNNDCSYGRICSAEGECIEQPDCGNGECTAYLQENCATCPQDCGKCKELCDVCSTDEDCFDGKEDNKCLVLQLELNSQSYNGKGVCSKSCSSDEDCPEGYVCKNFKLASEEQIKQCYSQMDLWGIPLCVTNNKCIDSHEGRQYCQGSNLTLCDDWIEKELSFDCSQIGLQCAEPENLPAFKRSPNCYGSLQLGEPCKGTLDCDPYNDLICTEGICLPYSCDDDNQCPENYYCDINTYQGCYFIDFPCKYNKDCAAMQSPTMMAQCSGMEGHRRCIEVPGKDCNIDEDCPVSYFCDMEASDWKGCSVIGVTCGSDEDCKQEGFTQCIGPSGHKRCI